MLIQDPTIRQSRLIPRPYLPQANQISSSEMILINGGEFVVGLNCAESLDFDQGPTAKFGWDLENPATKTIVKDFKIQDRPVTVWEYLLFLKSKNMAEELIPFSWANIKDEWYVKTIYGPIPFAYSKNWPASVSHFQASAYAENHNCRLPTENEINYVRSQVGFSGTNYGFRKLLPTDVLTKQGYVTDLVGSGWELTSTLLRPFDGYVKSELYPGFSSDFL
jgi:formylglycine-generating enzyme required for sulfatase activity